MSKSIAPQIVSANALRGGEVIYLTESGVWSACRRDAAVACGAGESAELLAIAQAQPALAVGPYLVDIVVSSNGVPEPLHMREAMRAHGPTVGPDSGGRDRASTAASRHHEPVWLDCA